MAYYSNVRPPRGFMEPNLGPQVSGQAAFESSQPQPDLLQNFLSQLTKLLGEREEPETPMAPGPPTMDEHFNLAALAPYAPQEVFKANLQRAQANRQAQTGGAAARNKARRARIDDLQAAANLASLMPGRQAQLDLARARTEHLLSPQAGDDKVMIQVTSQDPATGLKTTKWVPRAVARQMYYSGEPIEVNSYAPRPSQFQSSEGIGFANPYTGGSQFLGGGAGQGGRLYPPLSSGMATTGIQNIETVAAASGLKGAWAQARKELGITDNPGLLDSFQYALSDKMSRSDFLRNPGALAKSLGFDPQAVLRYRSNLARNLNGYIKAQTGAQFSVAELEKYAQQFPLPIDDEATFDMQLRQILEPAIQRLNDIMRLYGGARGLLLAAQSNPGIAAIVDIDDLTRSIVLKPQGAAPAGSDWRSLVKP